MLKVLLLFACALAFVTAQQNLADGDIVEGCLYEDELWGSPDAKKFYFCLPGTNTSLEQSCPTNTLFVRNATVSGCIPVSLMDPNCVYLYEVGPCRGDNLKQPQPDNDPIFFHLCTSENAEPVKLPCPQGTAFVKQDGYLGCFAWARWRELRNCPE